MFAALAAGGCSLPFETLLANSDAEVEQTGSTLRPSDRSGAASNAASPAEADLAYARAAAVEALAHGRKDASIPWENPQTGASGNITPIAVSYPEGSFICRDFLASYVHGPSQAWLQGEACRTAHGQWQVRSLKPLRQG